MLRLLHDVIKSFPLCEHRLRMLTVNANVEMLTHDQFLHLESVSMREKAYLSQGIEVQNPYTVNWSSMPICMPMLVPVHVKMLYKNVTSTFTFHSLKWYEQV